MAFDAPVYVPSRNYSLALCGQLSCRPHGDIVRRRESTKQNSLVNLSWHTMRPSVERRAGPVWIIHRNNRVRVYATAIFRTVFCPSPTRFCTAKAYCRPGGSFYCLCPPFRTCQARIIQICRGVSVGVRWERSVTNITLGPYILNVYT